ncbi:MAG: MFS transporter [Chloroflexota bacterium]
MDTLETTSLPKILPTESKTQLVQTASYYAAFVALGLVIASLGPTLIDLAERTGTSLSQIGILFTVRSMGSLLGSLFGSRLYDHLPGHRIMVVMFLMLAATMSLIPLIPLLWLLCLALFVFGLAEATLAVGGNTLLVWVHEQRLAPYMNGLHFFFGVGAFLSPIIIAQAVLLSGDIIWAYWALALLLLPAAGWLLSVPSPGRRAAATDTPRRRPNYALVGLIALFYFLYVGAEVSFGGWIFSYAIALDLADKTMAAYLTSGFFGAFTVGRLLSIPLVARLRPRLVLLSDLAGSLLSLGVIMLWPTSLTAVWLGTVGCGLSMATIFPSILTMAGRRMSITGQITGTLFTGASLGAMSTPWLVGQLFEKMQPPAMIACLFIDLALATVVIVGIISAFNRQK